MMICHNCLLEIDPKKEHYRRLQSVGGRKPIYIHQPHCPEGADPLAHHNRMVRKGLAVV